MDELGIEYNQVEPLDRNCIHRQKTITAQGYRKGWFIIERFEKKIEIGTHDRITNSLPSFTLRRPLRQAMTRA